MENIDVINYANSIRDKRGYGKCLVTRLETCILPEFETLQAFSRASDHDIFHAYSTHCTTLKNGIKVVDAKPFIGKKLYDLCHDVQGYIINSANEEKKIQAAEIRRQNFEVLVERKRNPVFTIKALKSVIALAELAGAETVNLDKIFEVCDAFGVSLDTKEVAHEDTH